MTLTTTPEFIGGLTLSCIVLLSIFIICCALGEIVIRGINKSSWFSQSFVKLKKNDTLKPWHFYLFVFQFLLLIIGIILMTI